MCGMGRRNNVGLRMVCSSTRDWTSASFDQGRQTLKEWRENNARRSEEVVELWEHVLSRNPSNLADELWLVYEQVCVAALDCARVDLAMQCIYTLDARFPKSNRVLKLQAMHYEAVEKYDNANQLYEQLIESDPTNTAFRKRKIALLLARNNRLEAIKELNEYLKIFINDAEAWIQLSELFLAENDLAKAAHCIEECILLAPLNTLYHRRLGDLRYTMSGLENTELAKSYYEHAAKLNPADLRAQFGLLLCANYLLAHAKGSAEKKKDCSVAGTTAASKIITRYEGVDAGENPEISSLIDAVGQMKSAFSK